MNYRYDKVEDGTFIITEKATGYVVARNLEFHQAKHSTKRLNSGSGFNGWTPEFMLHQLKPTEFFE